MAGDDEPSRNPFIRWKQHVDSNISSTLQGIIGLPSAASRNLNMKNWPEVEEAHCKELEKRQQQEAQSQSPPSTNPFQQQQQTAGAENKPACPRSTPADSVSSGWNVSVFSPRDHHRCFRTHSGPNGFGSGSGAGSGQTPSDAGSPSDPNSRSAWPDWVQQARWHSFAAYSPYSPLNLRTVPQPRPLDLPAGEQSSFTFEDAFEDLLAVMSGRELTVIKEKAEMRRVLRNMFPTGEPAFYWVRRLQSQGLLNGYFPRADQLRKKLEERLDAESEEEKQRQQEEKQRQQELDERRSRMWKWVWSRHHPTSSTDREGHKKLDPADSKSFEEWDPEDWVKEMDSVLNQAAKDVRSELNNSGRIFGELDRIFKAVGKMGEAFTGLGEESLSSSGKEQARKKPAETTETADPADPADPADALEEETEEDYFSALAKASGSVSASTSTSTDPQASDSIGTGTRVFNHDDGTMSTHTASSSVNSNANSNNNNPKGPFRNSTTEESVDPATRIRTVKTTEEKVDKRGNRTVRTEIRLLNSDGEEISRQTSYSKSMSASWSWSSGSDDSGDSGDDDGWSRHRDRNNGEKDKDRRMGWFWK